MQVGKGSWTSVQNLKQFSAGQLELGKLLN
jgi:hypothetical protein